VPAKAGKNILRPEHELPTAAAVRSSQATPARRRGQLCTGGARRGGRDQAGEVESETAAGLKPESVVGLNWNRWWNSSEYAPAYFSPSWTPFQPDGGRDFSLIVDGVSV
jgi:hypothetical protein